MDDDGEIEVTIRPNSDCSSNLQASVSSDSFLDDLLRNSESCSHTHTCNPPGRDAAHTHTCYHAHTRVIPPEDVANEKSRPRRASGNREAVRKYREKKKAEAAHLEEEAKRLRLMNQVLMGKLQRQPFLEAEILRLRSLLLGIRGRIDDELPSQAGGDLGCSLIYPEKLCMVRE
ncbi:basic leucine zipper 23-like [Salvia miltiorrhiza]|uniref:basic leucine zipper 23-like n=1 Tax=Salvia miltiorrhiza TaxID=226208 RepID=UPI0025ACC2D6|nr:basic leucine zipper 23-like [Salvia miltiorrhiza]XP_057790031.1 basic leucine zipper 23-like [Salvia miltiorrhiza]